MFLGLESSFSDSKAAVLSTRLVEIKSWLSEQVRLGIKIFSNNWIWMKSAGGVPGGSMTSSLLPSEDICAFGAAYSLETLPFQPLLEIHKHIFWSLFFPPTLDHVLTTCADNSHDLKLVPVQLQRSQLSSFRCEFLRSCPRPQLASRKTSTATSIQTKGPSLRAGRGLTH